MKSISITGTYNFVIIDDEDYEKVRHLKWYMANGYAQRSDFSRKKSGDSRHSYPLKMHRVILGLEYGDKNQVDHINFDRMDNRRENITTCTASENSSAKPGYSSWCKYKGVYRTKKGNFKSCITVNNKTIQLGRHESELSAAIAYNNAALRYRGKFARLNKIDE